MSRVSSFSSASRVAASVRRAVLALALCALPGAAFALEYGSVSEAAVLYDAPSAKAKPLHVVYAGTPVEVVVRLEAWVKVRDVKGDLVWIEKRFLSDKRNLIVRAERAQIRATGDDKAALVFEAERDVILELPDGAAAASPEGWLKVRHRDGQSGFVRLAQVWGY